MSSSPERRFAGRLRRLADALDAGKLDTPEARASLAEAMRADAEQLDERGRQRDEIMARHTEALLELVAALPDDQVPDDMRASIRELAEALGHYSAGAELDEPEDGG